jgi:outer membrane protein TolC
MTKVFSVRFLAFLFLLVCNPVGLAAQQVYSLDSCITLALQTNKEIKAARHQVNKYEYEKKALRGNYFPNINVRAIDIYSTLDFNLLLDLATPLGVSVAQQLHDRLPFLINQKMQQGLASGITNKLQFLNQTVDAKVGNVLTVGATLTQPLYTGGKITTGYRMGKLGAQMAMLNEKLTAEQTVVAVHEAYQLMVKAKEMREVAVQYDSLLAQLTNDVQSALRNGMVSHNEEMKVKVKKSDAELKIKQAENGIRLARMNLCQIVGLPLDAEIDIQPSDNVLLATLIDTQGPMSGRTEYQLLELKSQLAEQQVKLERSNLLPQLGLIANASVIDGMELMGKKILDRKGMMNVGVSLTIPITHGNQTRNKVKAAKEEVQRQRMEQASLNEKMLLEQQQLANEVEEARMELIMRQQNLEQCAENLRISKMAYSVGYESLSDLLTAQLLWQQAYAELIETKYLLNIKAVKWRKTAGILL